MSLNLQSRAIYNNLNPKAVKTLKEIEFLFF